MVRRSTDSFLGSLLTSHLEGSDAATESIFDPLKRVKASTTAAKDQPKKSGVDDKPAAKANKSTEFAPARKATRTKATSMHTTIVDLTNTSEHPLWYAKVNPEAPFSRGDVVYLEYTRTLINNCLEARSRQDQESLEKNLTELTERIHSIEFCPISATEVKKSRMVESGGLGTVFIEENSAIFPHYLRADAQGLFIRWVSGDFEPSLYRGLKSIKTTSANGKTRQTNSAVDHDYPFKKSAKVQGAVALWKNGDSVTLVNGQWFPSRACAYRDGAHGELEAGIYGKKGIGAYSIVLARGGYADRDNGEVNFFSYSSLFSLTLEIGNRILWHSV
jgi:hypothetical protein